MKLWEYRLPDLMPQITEFARRYHDKEIKTIIPCFYDDDSINFVGKIDDSESIYFWIPSAPLQSSHRFESWATEVLEVNCQRMSLISRLYQIELESSVSSEEIEILNGKLMKLQVSLDALHENLHLM